MAKTKFLDYTGLAKLVEKIKNTYVNKNEQYEANLKWGGRNFAGSYGPIDGAMIPELGANRFAFGNPQGITIEYSNDGGSTWKDYGASDVDKLKLTSTGTRFTVGKVKSQTPANDMLRITFDTTISTGINCYSSLNKFCLYVSTGGSTGCYCTIQAAKYRTPTTFLNKAVNVSLTGWSGYNIINIDNMYTSYGDASPDNYGRIRFIFGTTGNVTEYEGLTISKIYAFGGVGWNVPSNMSKNGHLYYYDEAQNATFPANITATKFIGTLQGNASSASKLGTATVGSATKPMYLNGGTPTECTYTLAQNVTSASKLTDTTYSASTGLSLSKDNKFSINAATSSTIGGVKIGSGITVDTGGTISLTKANVTNALGYTPPTADTNTTYTFTSGTGGTFTVKASNSTKAQTISVGKTASASTADNAVNAQTAETANKLSVNAGSDMTPIYFKDGVPKPCDSTLGVNINGRANSASLADKLSIKSIKSIKDSVDDVLVIGNYSGGPIFIGGGIGPGEFSPTDIIAKDGDYYPLNVSKANTANSATKLNTGTTGTSTKPVYFNNGVPATCTYELNKTVPSTAVFTDTKYTLSGDGTNKVTITDSNKSPQSITINNVQRATVATYANQYSYNGMDRDFVYDAVDGGNHYIRCKDATIISANGTNLNKYEFIINSDGKGGCYIHDVDNAKGTTWGPNGIVFEKAPANSLVAANGTFITAITDPDIENEIKKAIVWPTA